MTDSRADGPTTPDELFAGTPREYDVFTRQLMRLLMKRMGHPTDASHAYDYTGWDASSGSGARSRSSPVPPPVRDRFSSSTA